MTNKNLKNEIKVEGNKAVDKKLIASNAPSDTTTITGLDPSEGVQAGDLFASDRASSSVASSALEIKEYTLMDYSAAIKVPDAGVIVGGPFMHFDNNGNPIVTGGRFINVNDGGGLTVANDIHFMSFSMSDLGVVKFDGELLSFEYSKPVKIANAVRLNSLTHIFKQEIFAGGTVSGYLNVQGQPDNLMYSWSPTDNSYSLVSKNQTYNASWKIHNDGYLEYQGGNTVYPPRLSDANLLEHSVMFLGEHKAIHTVSLAAGQALVGNGVGQDPSPQTVLTQSSTEVICEFNSGSSVGVTDFSGTLVFKRTGNVVNVSVPAMGAIAVTSVIFGTSSSANPGRVPVSLRPAKTCYGFITTNSNNTVPAGAAGCLQIDPNGNIDIYYQNTNGQFPASVYGGTGFSQTGDNRIQNFTYFLD